MGRSRDLANLGDYSASSFQIDTITDTSGGNTTSINSTTPTVNTNVGKNLLMNGGFNVWQRGTSITGTNNVWGPDRWKVYGYASNSVTVSKQSAIGSISDCEYFMRIASTSNRAWTNTNIEDVRQFHNQTVTLSFWAKTSGATTAESLTFDMSVIYDTSGGGSASDNNIAPETFNLTSSWQKFTKTFTFPDMSAKSFGNNPRVTMTLYTPDYGSSVNLAVDFAKFQLEYGSSDTSFERKTYDEELKLCQRYYEYGKSWAGPRYSDSVALMYGAFKVTKRTIPTMTYSSISGGTPGTNTADVSEILFYCTSAQNSDGRAWWYASAEF